MNDLLKELMAWVTIPTLFIVLCVVVVNIKIDNTQSQLDFKSSGTCIYQTTQDKCTENAL